jgi:hypothetical protein
MVGLIRRLLHLGVLGSALRTSNVDGFIVLRRGRVDLLSLAFGIGLVSVGLRLRNWRIVG